MQIQKYKTFGHFPTSKARNYSIDSGLTVYYLRAVNDDDDDDDDDNDDDNDDDDDDGNDSYWLLAIGCWLLAVDRWLLAVGC